MTPRFLNVHPTPSPRTGTLLRRRLLLTSLATISIGGLAWILPGAKAEPTRRPPGESHAQGVYIPPTTWDNYPATVKTSMLQLDAIAWNLEQTSGGATMMASITTSIMMGSQQTDELKEFFTQFLESSGRDGYWAEVALGLNPANTSPEIRAELIRCMIARIKQSSPASIPQAVISTIAANPDPDANVNALQLMLVKTAGQ